MKLFKRIVSLVLCLLLLSSGTFSVLASAAPLACPKCGGTESHAEDCELGKMAALFGMPFSRDTKPAEESSEPSTEAPAVPAAVECETCGAVDCTSTHENWCAVCKKDDCGQTHTACDKCGAVDCQNTHETWCEICKKDDCGQTHAACDKCGTVDCQNTHENWCDVCKKDDCGQTHTPGNAENPSEPSQPTEDQQEPAEPEGPKVGDKIWIKSGSKVYKNHNNVDKNFYTLMGSYEVEIKKILTNDEGAAEWYEFRFTNLGIGEIALSMGGYKYVHVENTTTVKPEDQEPEDEHACNCGENAPENLANHADSCPRKQYIKTLFEGKTAEEIHSQWETYDEATRNDLLAMLEVYDQAKFEALKKLTSFEDEVDVYIQYEDTTLSGVCVNVSAPEGAFPEGITVSVTDTEVSSSSVSRMIDGDIRGIVAVDISFDGRQPTERVAVTIEIPESKVPDDANMVTIIHFGDNGPEIVGSRYLNTASIGETVSFVTGGFSSYAAVFVNGKYTSQKMSSVLANDTRFSIETFGVDLFDYDPVTINNALNGVTTDGNGFHFTGYGISGMGSNNGINNSSSEFAKQGILQNTLSNGLPVFNYLEGANAGVNTGKVLFSDSEYTNVKTTYNNIPFEFVYDNYTKYYEYRSSANHAQLNNAGTKIELYADTLSTNNQYAATIDLSTANGISDISNVSATTSMFSGTVTDGNSNNRLDPYAVFTVNNVTASTVGQIYVRAKVPADVGTNDFQLFFTTNNSTGWSEDKSFGNQTYSKAIPYTANGDWIEFVIDTSENPNWKDTITAIRIDLFDSNKGNMDITKTYSVQIEQVRFIQKNYDAYATRGGFYPFSEIQDSYPGNNVAFDLGTWKNLIEDSTKTNVTSSRSIYNPTPNPATDLYSELAYGLVMEFDFYLPVKWTGNDLTYYFNGDDDLWVFVDDKLVLDIGGGHGAITGTVNFTKHTWKVDNAVTVTGYNSGANGTASAKTGTLDASVYTPGKHTMKIFYLERGGSVSNCYMKFNLPRTPTGDVTVSKNVVEANGADASVLNNETFEFQISAIDKGAGEHLGSNLANKSFIRVNADGTTTPSTTDANGKFILKHGQYAIFEGINENHDVTVTETRKDILGYDYVSTTVNGIEGLTLTQLTEENKQKKYDFVNTYRELQATITYIPVNPAECPDNSKGTVELTGDDSTATCAKIGVSETIGVRVGVPVGSTAEETNAVKFVGWYSDPECTQKIENDEVFMPTKPAGSELWQDATYYAKFEFKYGNLTITKNGIKPVDHHEATTTNNKETQSTIYNISGTSYAGDVINMNVVIVGNSSTTITSIPAGIYTVTEDNDWSWRYEPQTNGHEVEVIGGQTAETTFNNDREMIYWLSGDSYCENWWGGENGAVLRKD